MQATWGAKRAGLALIVCLGAVSAALDPAPARAETRCSQAIRVLVARPARSTTLQIEGHRYRFEPSGDGVRVDGGTQVAHWRGGGTGLSAVGDVPVRGILEVRSSGSGLVVINEVPLEEYVVGVLAAEIPSTWASAALEAQAVASRTYALHQVRAHRGRLYHVEADTQSQVYAGAESPPSLREAVRDTRCQVLTHAGRPILAAFHSASGGRTASAQEVWGQELAYLVSQEVSDEDDSPDTYWRAGITRTTLGRALAAEGHRTGDVSEAEVLARSQSGRVALIRFRGPEGEVRLSGRELRRALGETTLRSTLFELRSDAEGYVFVGSGRGHGVGMSQWGARGLAERGKDYESILSAFYPGTALVRWPGDPMRSASDGAREVNTREEREVAIRREERR
jgi:stage II sporulation protein D